MANTNNIKSCLEFGAGFGANLQALRMLIPHIKMTAIDINKMACEKYLSQFIDKGNIYNQSIFDFKVKKQYDLIITSGMLMHIDSNKLDGVYKKLYESSAKYIVIIEYYNPTPVTIDYRGKTGILFKRDFAGEIMDKYKDLELVDYGFCYHRDNNFKLDDSTWFLLKRNDCSCNMENSL